jgi:hypothetical protein
MTTKRLLACAFAALIGGVLVAKADYFSYNLHGRLEDSVTRFNKQAANLLPIPRGYIAGCTTSPSSVTILQITGCYSVDSTNAVVMNQTSTFTKSTAGSWTAGSGNNGMGAGLTIAFNTWYHVFQIVNGGLVDYYFDTNVGAANAPAGTTAFRRIGSFLTNGSSQIISFSQNGDEFLWLAAIADITTSTLSTTATLFTLSGVPPGVKVNALMRGGVANSGTVDILINSPDETTIAGGSIGSNANIVAPSLGGAFSISIRTNTTQQIRAVAGGASTTLDEFTYGWIDTRGKNN